MHKNLTWGLHIQSCLSTKLCILLPPWVVKSTYYFLFLWWASLIGLTTQTKNEWRLSDSPRLDRFVVIMIKFTPPYSIGLQRFVCCSQKWDLGPRKFRVSLPHLLSTRERLKSYNGHDVMIYICGGCITWHKMHFIHDGLCFKMHFIHDDGLCFVYSHIWWFPHFGTWYDDLYLFF